VNPHEPTDFPPGSPGKLEVMAERLRLGLPLFHLLDADYGRAGPPGPRPPPAPVGEDRRIAAAYRAGHSIEAVAVLLGRSATAVRNSLQRQEVVRRSQGRPRTPPEVELRMAQLYHGGHSIRAVAALTGYSPTGVRTALRRQGLAFRPRSGSVDWGGPGLRTWPQGR
jgi:transposase